MPVDDRTSLEEPAIPDHVRVIPPFDWDPVQIAKPLDGTVIADPHVAEFPPPVVPSHVPVGVLLGQVSQRSRCRVNERGTIPRAGLGANRDDI